MDFGAFRPLSIFTWRPSVSDAHRTRRTDEQTQNTNAQAVTSNESATRSMAFTAVMFADPLLSGRRAGRSYKHKRRRAPKRYVVSNPLNAQLV